jgi:hypothetical protein
LEVLDHHRAVGVFLDIELEPVGAVGDAALEGGNGVFGRHPAAATVGDDLRRLFPVWIVGHKNKADHGHCSGRNSRREDDRTRMGTTFRPVAQRIFALRRPRYESR